MGDGPSEVLGLQVALGGETPNLKEVDGGRGIPGGEDKGEKVAISYSKGRMAHLLYSVCGGPFKRLVSGFSAFSF